MERQSSSTPMEKLPSFGKGIEKQKSFRGFMEKQKSFRIVMEKQLSFIGGDRSKKTKDSPGKRGDSQLHLAARAGNLVRLKEILHNCSPKESLDLLSKPNQEGETPLYIAAENGHSMLVGEMLKHIDLHTASLPAKNAYDPFHIAARQGHLGS